MKLIAKLTPLFLSTFLVCTGLSAQKISVVKGSLKELKDHKSYSISFTYDDVTVGKDSEEVYTSRNVAEKNEKEPGSGDEWLSNWNSNKTGDRFSSKFVQLFNENLAKNNVSIKRDDASATCQILANVYFIEPGFNVGVMRKPAYVSMTLTFMVDGIETAVLKMEKSPGADAVGFDFDAAYRIQEAYAKGGKSLARTLADKVYK